MLIFAFFDVFSTDEINKKVNVRYFDRMQTVDWISHSTIQPARSITIYLASKAQSCKPSAVNSNIKSKKDVVRYKLDTKQVSQTIRAALALHKFRTIDKRIRQAFRINFYDVMCSIMLFNAGCFVLRIRCTIAKTSPLNPDRIPTVFACLVPF